MDTSTIVFIFGCFIIVMIGVVCGWAVTSTLQKPFQKEMEEEAFIKSVQNRSDAMKDKLKAESFITKVGSVLEKLLPTSRSRLIEYQSKLDAAGMKTSAGTWHGIVIFATVATAVFGALLSLVIAGGLDFLTLLVATLICAFLGWLIPKGYLYLKTKNRREEIEKRLPDALERLANIALSGMTIDEAFLELARADDLGAVGEEFARVSREINFVNIPREEALMAMANRCQCVDVTFFTSSIIQALKDGTPVANALQQQAVNARAAWFDRLKAEINKLDTKITIPLGICYMPGTMLLVIAPVVYQMVDSFMTVF